MTVVGTLLWFSGAAALLLWRFREPALACWREPVLRRSVLIVESDDWGPGPDEDVTALRRIRAILARHWDRDGRPPVMTIGVVLALADTPKIAINACSQYARKTLLSPEYQRLREVLLEGEAEGVFALQLHGLEHYWPEALMHASQSAPAVRSWLTEPGHPRTERLPPALQSRWIDASTLPSWPHSPLAVDRAVDAEVKLFHAVFHRAPTVVVPPTFVWDQTVENAWARHQVRVVVTSGRRHPGRDADGALVTKPGVLFNGQLSTSGLRYMVRKDYFEPCRGHTVERALKALAANTAAGRPTLLETHRFNFTELCQDLERSYAQLDLMFSAALSAHPRLSFLATGDLAERIASNDPSWLVTGRRDRTLAWLRRLEQLPGVRKQAIVTGVVLVVWMLRAGIQLSLRRKGA